MPPGGGERTTLDAPQGLSQQLQESQLHRMGQRWRLVLRSVFLVLAALVWIAFVEDASHEHRLTLAAVSQRDSNLATAVEHYIVRVLRTARAVHRLLDAQLAQGHSEAELADMLADRLRINDAFEELALCLADGRVLAAPVPAPQLDAATCARMLTGVPPGPEITVLPPIPGTGTLHVPLALALDAAGGRRLAVAVALTPAETMLGIMRSTVLHDDTAVLLTAADGLPLAAWRSGAGHVTDAAGFGPLADLKQTRNGTASIAGREYRVSSRSLPQADLHIQVATASDDALHAFHARRARLLALCVLLTVGLAAVYRLLARMHSESLARALALSRARAELQALNERLDLQVQERTAQLEQAYRDLESFSYSVAHDVRAPLASISGFAEALAPALSGSGNPKHLHYLNRIRANATHLDEMTRQLLELGRLTRAPLRHTRVDLSALARDVLARLREDGAPREVEARVEPGLQAHGDPALLRQVLENLLGNAWKFTSRRASAHIGFGRDAGRARGDGQTVFVISDDGEGFDSDQAHGLFQPFRRMHGSDEFPGSGVGLAAVRRIVALHGGQVWCSAREGAGARFFFSLPAGQPDEAPGETSPASAGPGSPAREPAQAG
jgi:signal transduction histidine kinase